MNTTININLAGSSFCIDQEAYDILQNYMASVERNLSSDTDKKEVMADIEARIAELFVELRKTKHQFVITTEMVHDVIEQLGKPSDFSTDNADDTYHADSFDRPADYEKPLLRRRLYRDTNNQVIAGVCSGLGHWLGIDAIWLRLFFVVCAIAWGFTALIYILLWIVMPEAKTAAQRLEMRGESATLDNIEREIKTNDINAGNRSSGFLSTLAKIFLWTIGGLVLSFFGIIFFAILFGLFGVFSGLAAVSPLGIFTALCSDNIGLAILAAILAIVVIGLPLVGLIYALIKHFKDGERLLPQTVKISALIWALALVGCVVIGVYELVTDFDKIVDFDPSRVVAISDDEDDAMVQQISVLPFHSVVVSGAARIELSNSDEQYIEGKFSDKVRYDVTDSVLNIEVKDKSIYLNIYTPVLRQLTLSGAARLETDDVFKTDGLSISATGASLADLKIEVENLNIEASGASKIELEGSADRLTLDLTGASKAEAKDMEVRVADVELSGASKAKVNVTDSLNATASGASRIKYKGHPHLESRATGGSRISR